MAPHAVSSVHTAWLVAFAVALENKLKPFLLIYLWRRFFPLGKFICQGDLRS